jgi:ABC-type lipoprotein export system ATPase subunit
VNGGAGIELDHVAKRYESPSGSVRAVDGVSLEVHPGTSLAITGPSGCGKSTLLGLIGGLDVPTAGRVSIDGRVVSAMTESDRARLRRSQVGFVFQSDDLLPFLTATENVSLLSTDAGDDDGDGSADQLLARLGLAEEADRFPDQLSGGQRQRVAVARAVIHRPNLVVADEPTGSLDPESAEAVVALLLAAQRAAGSTLVLVTHDPAIAARLDRAVGMRDGRLVDAAAAGATPPNPDPSRA